MWLTRHFPLFGWLAILNILGGFLILAVGSVLLDIAHFPESSVQAMTYLKDFRKNTTDQEAEDMKFAIQNETELHNLLYVLGLLAIVFGIMMLVCAIEMICFLRVRDGRSLPSWCCNSYRNQVEDEIGRVVAIGKRRKPRNQGP